MKVLRWLWALIPVLTAGTLSWIVFGVIAARRRSVPMALAAVVYLAMFALMASPACQGADGLNGLGGAVLCTMWGASSLHALWWAGAKRSPQQPRAAMPVAAFGTVPAGPSPVPGSDVGPELRDALLAEIRFSATRFGAAPPDRRITPDIWEGLQRIVGESWTVLATAHQKGIVGDQLIAVEMMYSDYVPSSVRAVTALTPEQLVTTEDAARANRTAREIVESINRELTSMMRAVGSGDLLHLDEQRAFLQSRFGQTGSIRL